MPDVRDPIEPPDYRGLRLFVSPRLPPAHRMTARSAHKFGARVNRHSQTSLKLSRGPSNGPAPAVHLSGGTHPQIRHFPGAPHRELSGKCAGGFQRGSPLGSDRPVGYRTYRAIAGVAKILGGPTGRPSLDARIDPLRSGHFGRFSVRRHVPTGGRRVFVPGRGPGHRVQE